MSRRPKWYKCVCQNCGQTIVAKYPRVYCDECYRYGKALTAADQLEAQLRNEGSCVDAISNSEIDAIAAQVGCAAQSVRNTLRRRGYRAIIVYVKEGRV